MKLSNLPSSVISSFPFPAIATNVNQIVLRSLSISTKNSGITNSPTSACYFLYDKYTKGFWNKGALTTSSTSRFLNAFSIVSPLNFMKSFGTENSTATTTTLNSSSEIPSVKQLKNLLKSGVCVIPHPEKVAKGGEDAYFITPTVIGVADGVGGWADVGVDPALYSRKLMQDSQMSSLRNSDPLKILEDGYNGVSAARILGSSTACIISLDGDNLKAINVGDSGFMIIRDSKIMMKTKEQQHSFNCPYQLGEGSTDKPRDGDKYDIKVKNDDVIILGTDGLFDNLFPEQILDIFNQVKGSSSTSSSAASTASSVSSSAESINDVKNKYSFHFDVDNDSTKIANALGRATVNVYSNPRSVTPFGRAARMQGGKPDDVTVVVSRINILSQDTQTPTQSPTTPRSSL